MRKISSRWDSEKRARQFKTLLKFFRQCREEDELLAAIETLLTASEKAAIAQRLAIIRKLEKGESYPDIRLELRVSPSTINKTLDLYHKNGQHNTVFSRLLREFKFEPKIPVPKSVRPNLQKNLFHVGTRQIIRESREK